MKSLLATCYDELLNQGTAQFREITHSSLLKESMNFPDEFLALLNDKWFVEFTTHPQVNGVLADAISYNNFCAFLEEHTNQDLVSLALLDDACNWCIEIIQKNWGKGDDVVAVFRDFWRQLLRPQDVRNAFWTPFTAEHTEEYCKKVEKKLRLELQQEFTQRQPDYAKILYKYTNAIKTYYHNGFIYMLGEFKFNDFYIPPVLSPNASLRDYYLYFDWEEAQNRWRNIFDQDNILYVIGVPGSGKSLFLHNMINNYENMTFPYSQDYLIIYCDMKTFYTNGGFNKKSIPDFLQESIINTVGMEKNEVTIDFIHYYLQIGRCIVLMDALDEVPRDHRMALHKKVVSFFKTTHPNNKVCITSRARGFLPQEEIKVFYISELTEKDISNYLDKMIALNKFKESDKDNFLAQAQVLIEKHFLTNFLTLSLMVNIYKAERELPENKIELYKKCFEYIAKKRERENGGQNYDWEKLSILMKDSTFISLSTLAAPNNTGIARKDIEDMLMKQYHFKYTDEATTEDAVRQFLDFCSSRTDLFVLADTDDKFKFFHRSFFEYFYSRYITQQGSVEEMYRLMSRFDEDSEVFELVIALVKEENEEKYQELVNLIFKQAMEELQSTTSSYRAFKILTLSMPVIDDAYFRCKYVQIVTENFTRMVSKSAQRMNQVAISIALKKCFQTCPQSESPFQQKYRPRCISYVMGRFKSISASLKEEAEYTERSAVYRHFLRAPVNFHSATSVPFYVYAYPDIAALQDELGQWGASDIQNFLSTIPSSRDKRKLQNAFKYFEQCEPSHRKEVLESFPVKVMNLPQTL